MILTILVTICCLYIGLVFFQKRTFRAISIMLSPFVRLLIEARVYLKLEDKNRKKERFGIPSKPRPFGKLIWIHAVSVGETISCIPFIEEFKKINKDTTIVMTTITIEAAKLIEQRLGDTVIHQYLPYDVFTWVRRFVKYWKPDAVFFVEAELWPTTLYYLYEKDIPIYLLNTRMSSKTLKRMYIAKKIFNILPYKLFTTVFVPSDEIKAYVRDLGAREVVVIPNLKIISKKLPVNESFAEKLGKMINGRKVWIAVSTHKGEEEIIINAHNELKKIYPDILTVIAIRHCERANDIKKLCDASGFTATLHTESFEIGKAIDSDFYILNKMGCLGEFFEKIDAVVVCGSLVPGIGGHNFLEPFQFRCNVATGKYIENFRDIYEYLSKYCVKLEENADIAKFVAGSLETYKRPKEILEEIDYTNSWIKAIKQMSRLIYKR